MFTAAHIAAQVAGELVGDSATPLTGIAPAATARPGDLTFAEKESYFAAAEESLASAVIVPAGFTSAKKVLIRVANPRIAIAKLLPLFFPPEVYPPGIAPGAAVDPTAQIDPTAHIGAHCVIGAGVRIGARTALLGGNHIGRDSRIGDDTVLYPNVVLYYRTELGNRVVIHSGTTIGSDGYGYVFDAGQHRKVLQVGNVVIHDDVEIGANTAIDRGALGSTVIGQGCKIDNLVHIAHNVVLGRHCLVLGQSGFAGSTKLGDYVVVASQAGIAGHLTIGTQATIGAKSGVMRDVPNGATVLGSPAFPDKQMKRQWIATAQLPELIRRLRDLEKQVKDLSA